MESIIYHPRFVEFVFYLAAIFLIVLLLGLVHEVLSRKIDKRIKEIRRRT